jgi:hypothetical protein
MFIPFIPDGNDWTDAELFELDRLRVVCERTGQWEMDRGRSDEGDPWCALYAVSHHGVVLHIARIDRAYCVICPMGHQKFRSSRLAAAVDQSLRWLSNPDLAFLRT